MYFQYVDSISSVKPWESIAGVKYAWHAIDEGHGRPDGTHYINPAMALEALTQLAGWLAMVSSDFTRRPMPMEASGVRYAKRAPFGSRVELEVEMLGHDDEVMNCRGRATLGDQVIVELGHYRSYLVPIEELCDPGAMRAMWDLKRSDAQVHAAQPPVYASSVMDQHVMHAYAMRFVDQVQEVRAHELARTAKTFAAADELFKDHFPRKPVLPLALLLTLMSEAAQCLYARGSADSHKNVLVVNALRRVQCRKFALPDIPCMTMVKLLSGSVAAVGDEAVLQALVDSNGQQVLKVDMDVCVTVGP